MLGQEKTDLMNTLGYSIVHWQVRMLCFQLVESQLISTMPTRSVQYLVSFKFRCRYSLPIFSVQYACLLYPSGQLTDDGRSWRMVPHSTDEMDSESNQISSK